MSVVSICRDSSYDLKAVFIDGFDLEGIKFFTDAHKGNGNRVFYPYVLFENNDGSLQGLHIPICCADLEQAICIIRKTCEFISINTAASNVEMPKRIAGNIFSSSAFVKFVSNLNP